MPEFTDKDGKILSIRRCDVFTGHIDVFTEGGQEYCFKMESKAEMERLMILLETGKTTYRNPDKKKTA